MVAEAEILLQQSVSVQYHLCVSSKTTPPPPASIEIDATPPSPTIFQAASESFEISRSQSVRILSTIPKVDFFRFQILMIAFLFYLYGIEFLFTLSFELLDFFLLPCLIRSFRVSASFFQLLLDILFSGFWYYFSCRILLLVLSLFWSELWFLIFKSWDFSTCNLCLLIRVLFIKKQDFFLAIVRRFFPGSSREGGKIQSMTRE